MGREGHLQCLAWGSLPHSSTKQRYFSLVGKAFPWYGKDRKFKSYK